VIGVGTATIKKLSGFYRRTEHHIEIRLDDMSAA
jgi:hypothetical protein